jgi:hypothetical protein
VLSLPNTPNPYALHTCSHVVIVYRISSGGYAKIKPSYIQKETCLLNFIASVTAFVTQFASLPVRFILIKDGCTDALSEFATTAVSVLRRKSKGAMVVDEYRTSLGDGAASFNYALDALRALSLPADTTAVYMVEDDYLHVKSGVATILSGLALAPYVTGYDHPDKYLDAGRGGNPLITAGGEVTRVYRGPTCHWRGTNSTTMTFATTLGVLLQDESIMRTFTTTAPPDDFHMFLALGTMRGRLLVSPLPAASTHGETAFLSPFGVWEKLGRQALDYWNVLKEEPASRHHASSHAPSSHA